MKLDFKDIYIRPLKVSDINIRYINWFSDLNVTEFLEARNITIEDSKSYLINGYKTGQYYIYAICLDKKDLHIGNIKIGPIKRKEGISDLVTVIGDKEYWGKGAASIAITKAIFQNTNMLRATILFLFTTIIDAAILKHHNKHQKFHISSTFNFSNLAYFFSNFKGFLSFHKSFIFLLKPG